MDTENSKFRQGFKQDVREVESFGFKKCLRDFLGALLMLQEVGILPISILGAVWLSFNARMGCLVVFALRGYLAN